MIMGKNFPCDLILLATWFNNKLFYTCGSNLLIAVSKIGIKEQMCIKLLF